MRYNAESFTSTVFENKLNKLFNIRYGEERGKKKHQYRKAFVDDYNDKYNIDIDGVQKHWFAHTRKPTVQQLMNICELLDCDIDYFLTDQEEFKKEVASAAEVTGLPYEAIEFIKSISKKGNYPNMLDFQFVKMLFSSKEVYDALIPLLSLLVFGIDRNECEALASIYDEQIDECIRSGQIQDDGSVQCFADEISKSDFNYYVEYKDDKKKSILYAPLEPNDRGALGFSLIQELSKLSMKEKTYREENNEDVFILSDWLHMYRDADYILSDDEIEGIVFDFYNVEEKEKIKQKGINVRFKETDPTFTQNVKKLHETP